MIPERIVMQMVGGSSYVAVFETTKQTPRLTFTVDYTSKKHPYKLGDKIVLERKETIR